MAHDPKPGPEDRGFTVVDRRAGASGEKASAPAPEPASELPRVDFSTFVLSLGTSALYHLGALPHPETGQKLDPPELALARQTIDTLEMLEEKTRGNLEQAERELVQGLLYELRLRFVAAGKGHA
jgi:hypothetical protein